jgi:peptidyl-tRNA hydrolase, PTH1 family
MKLLIGLGNPGDKYQATRHNIGFEALDHLRHKLQLPEFKEDSKLKGQVSKNQEIILYKPSTFMNNSGMGVSKVLNYYKIPLEDIIVVHDELDLLLGKIKLKKGGGAGGHHGIESIIEALNSPDFVRIRLGIGNSRAFLGEHKRASFEADKFVLEVFLPGENSKVKSMIKKVDTIVETILKDGLEKAQNAYH